jgi:endonuclease/exonuclease/phosphatase family metal-dependent hydrolase
MTNDSTRPVRAARRKPAILLAAVAILALAVPAVADAKKGKKKGGPKVTVMTRNVYLGADLTPAIEAATLGEAIGAAGDIAAEVDSTNFPERAVLIAEEIKKSKADLIGLQEVAKWTDQAPSDGGSPPISPIGDPATGDRYDFLALLEQELKNAGAKYKVVGVQEEFEAELPANTDGDAGTGLLGADEDVRLQMRDVILAKKGSKVDTGKVDQGNYTTRFETEVGGLPVAADRGWLSVEAKIEGGDKGKNASASKKGGSSKFRFINTHLEAFGDPTIREAQAKELIAGPADTNKQVILVGDLNSGLPDPHGIGVPGFGDPNDPLAFQAFVAAGFKDNGAQPSCCDDPRDPNPVFDHTVDHVLTKKGLKTKKAFITGDEGERSASGLAASDHRGVVSKLQLKR